MKPSIPSLFAIMLIIVVAPAQAQEVVDIYSDLKSCDVTVEGDVGGCHLQVALSSPTRLLQTKTFPLDGPGTWIAEWTVPGTEEGSYVACAKLLKEGEILSERCYDFYYGGRVNIRFDVRDFYADYRGMHLLVYSDDPAVVDIYYMLIKENKALYVSKEDSVPISGGFRSPAEFQWEWKQLLTNNENYAGRVKIVEKKNNQIRAFMNTFVAKDDAEITDTYEDETGASATVLGKSRVPFRGALNFTLSQDGEFITSVEEKTPVLLTGDDETVEISWDETLDPGVYQLSIRLLGNDKDLIDFKESIIEAEIPPRPPVVETTEEESPMIAPVFGLVALISAAFVLTARRRRG